MDNKNASVSADMITALGKKALEARQKSYAPYSHFAVGAALLTADNEIYTGCNIENAAFTPTNCAERTAVFKAVSEGKKDFTAIAIAGGPIDKDPTAFCAPCGVCRQVLAEFCDLETFKIYLVKAVKEDEILSDGELTADKTIVSKGKGMAVKAYTFKELLPEAFGPGSL